MARRLLPLFAIAAGLLAAGAGPALACGGLVAPALALVSLMITGLYFVGFPPALYPPSSEARSAWVATLKVLGMAFGNDSADAARAAVSFEGPLFRSTSDC